MYPVNIKMDGRACLVIGGGHVAQRKVCTLLEEKAAVTVIRLADGKIVYDGPSGVKEAVVHSSDEDEEAAQ